MLLPCAWLTCSLLLLSCLLLLLLSQPCGQLINTLLAAGVVCLLRRGCPKEDPEGAVQQQHVNCKPSRECRDTFKGVEGPEHSAYKSPRLGTLMPPQTAGPQHSQQVLHLARGSQRTEEVIEGEEATAWHQASRLVQGNTETLVGDQVLDPGQ
jgi:hypothetical protein